MKTIRIAAFAAAAVLTLSACGGSPTPTVTVTETSTPSSSSSSSSAPAPAPAPAPEPEPAVDDHEIAQLALQMNWDQYDSDQRDLMCNGYNMAPDLMLDSFMEGAGDGIITRDDAEQFFDTNC